ncbi:MAG: histidine kinase [Thermoanaerobaculia bacterium]|jgi:two-component system LytT family sensor kinase
MPHTAPTSGSPWNRAAVLALLWATLGLAGVSQFYFVRADLGERASPLRAFFFPPVLDWYLWILFIPAVVFVAARFPLDRASWPITLGAHLATLLLLAWAHRALSSWILEQVRNRDAFATFVMRPPRPGPPRGIGPGGVLRGIAPYVALSGAYYLLDYYRKYRERELKAAELERELARAELSALQMQLQPHFLFNTLHVIGVLMHTEPDTAHRMIAQLSDLLRMSLDGMAEPEIPLDRELAFVERYLAIQQVRFRDRLAVRYAVGEEVRKALVPNLILQPLVENAVEHGIAPNAGRGAIEIEARRRDGALEVRVRNDGRPLGAKVSAGAGIGLENTRRRLARLYGSEAQLELANAAEGGVEARVRIPLRLAAPEKEDRSDA